MGKPHQGTDLQEVAVSQLGLRREREQALVRLIERAGQGDQTALAALYDETSSLVYGLAMRILQDTFAAEEVTIEVFTQVYRRASSYDPARATPSARLVMLTRNWAIDRLRLKSRRRGRVDPLENAAAIPSLADDPEERTAEKELRGVARTALTFLSPEQREVIGLAYYSGLTQSEIAATLEQPLGTVITRIRTGMMVLRNQLHPFLEEV